MYVVNLTFDGDPGRRLAARPSHRDALGRLRNGGDLVMAGPWADDSGALLVFDTDDAGLRKILAADPYYSTPGVAIASVRRWRPIVGP
jgi:uncharacterized protein YciI